MARKRKIILRLTGIAVAIAIIILSLVTIIMIDNDIPKGLGQSPKAERLARIQQSPNYKDGAFHNPIPTRQITSDKGALAVMRKFIFGPKKHRRPEGPLPIESTELKSLGLEHDLLIWLGHSSFFLQLHGKRVLIDPVLGNFASPLPWVNRAFKGDYPFSPETMPEIDYLVITHDHFDHLDYNTLKTLRPRVKEAIVPLGIGAHLERWGY